MDREFSLYLIETLEHSLPIQGLHVTLDFADRTRRSTYYMNEHLQLVIPLKVTCHGSGETHLFEHAAMVAMDDEDMAIDALMDWGEQWTNALQLATQEEVLGLDEADDFSAPIKAPEHPLLAAHARHADLIDTLHDCARSHFPVHAKGITYNLEGAPVIRRKMPHEDSAVEPAVIVHIAWGDQCEAIALPLLVVWANRHKLPAFFAGWTQAISDGAALRCDATSFEQCDTAEEFARAHL